VSDNASESRTRPPGLVLRLTTFWALLGGALLLAVAAMNVWSILSLAIIGQSFPGDFELTELGVAIAAFAFLPYCQMTDANVSADIFTQNARPRTLAALRALAALVAAVFGAILLWRMSYGLIDQRTYGYTTTILQIPVWWAFVPILVSLALLALAAMTTLLQSLGRVRA
jgi:TRAP-type C4-dicarboxylate transport system permease small subunit